MGIIEAVENNDIEFVKNNINKVNPNQNGQYGFPLLHRAVYWGHCEIVKLLLDNGADIDIFDEDRLTPLHSIIDGNEANWFDCIELLIKNGADVNTYLTYRDSGYKESVLMTAVRNEVYTEVIELLLKNGADVDYINSDGDKSINYAYDLRLYETVNLLERYGAIYDGRITTEEQILRDAAMPMDTYRDVAKKMTRDYLELEELTIDNNQMIPVTALGEKYNIDNAAAGELWTGVRMGMLQKNNDTMYGKTARKMYEDNIIDNIDNVTANDIGEQYNIDGAAGKNILKGLQAAQLHREKKIKKLDSNIPDGITTEHILKAVDDFNQGIIKHDFDESTTYDVIIDDNPYPPKAIIGLASRYILGKVLTPAHFSGGLQTKCFRILEENGFNIEQKSIIVYPDEIDEKEVHFEGTLKKVTVNTYERDNEARAKCIKKYGVICSVCEFNFEDKYGDIGAGFIHVHHLTPISSVGQEYHIDPVEDLRPVCPNCHAMLHKRRPEPYSIEELKEIIEKVNNQ